MKNRNISLIILLVITITQYVFAQDSFNFSPETGLAIFNNSLEEINKIKPGGILNFIEEQKGKKICSIQFEDDWFGIGKCQSKFISETGEKLNQITFHFPAFRKYDDICKKIIDILGEPSLQGESEKGSASKKYSCWVNGGLAYSIYDYSDSISFHIMESKFDSYTDYKLSPRTYALAQAYGDVVGDKVKRKIFLLGRRFDDTALYFDKLYLLIETDQNRLGKLIVLPKEYDGGYDPKLQLIDFTGDKIPELFISAATGGSGGIINYFVYSFLNDRPKILFSPQSKYQVKINAMFMQNYNASISIMNNKKKTIMDLSNDKTELQNLGAYDTNGKRINDKEIWINPYGWIEVKDIDNDGVNELIGTQAIKGVANYNSIGTVISTWKWKQNKFILLDANVSSAKR